MFGDRAYHDTPSLAAHVRMARIVRRGRRQFRVYEGGRTEEADAQGLSYGLLSALRIRAKALSSPGLRVAAALSAGTAPVRLALKGHARRSANTASPKATVRIGSTR